MLLIAFPIFFSIYFSIVKFKIQFEMGNKTTLSDQIEVVTPIQSIQWLKKGKEMVYQGKPFDIKSYKESNGNAIIRGYVDEKEHQLLHKIIKLVTGQSNTQKSSQTAYKLFLPFYKPVKILKVEEIDFSFASIHFINRKSAILELSLEQLSPPPKHYSI